jgi:hypothetical protein
MTQDEIIEMAQQCGLIGMRPHLDGIYSESLVAFANLVAAKALAQTQEPVSNDPLPRACNLAGVDYETFLKIKAYMPVAPPQRTEQEPLIGCVNHDCDKCKAQTQKPVAWIHNFIDGGISIGKRPADLNRHPDRWTALYKDPKPCPTCEALARTVMLDQTSHDTNPPQRTWVGLDEKDFSAINQSCLTKLQAATSAESILKEKNT